MKDIFTSDFFAGNRARLQEQTGSELIVLTANGLLQRSADTTFAFRQDSNFWYLTGVNEPDFVMVISADGGGTGTFLIAPKRSEHRDQWDGALDIAGMKARSGIDEVLEHHDGWNRLDKLLKKYKKVHTVAPFESYFEHFGFYANPARGVLLKELEKHKKIEIVDVRKVIAGLRQIKQEPELVAIKEAIRITGKGLDVVQKRLSKYKNEREAVADLTREFIRHGADGHAYTPIVACGGNAAVIHYMDNSSPIVKQDLLLLDVGAEVCGYSADITRTYAVTAPNKRQQAVYKSVERVHAMALKILKPGFDMKKYEVEVDKAMAVELKKLGLLDDVNDKKKLKKYYPHLASHFLGLDTHDAADYTRPLEPGMVLTVEPGIYIPEENIGIRIEDDVLITEKGVEVLSSSLPAGLFSPKI